MGVAEDFEIRNIKSKLSINGQTVVGRFTTLGTLSINCQT